MLILALKIVVGKESSSYVVKCLGMSDQSAASSELLCMYAADDLRHARKEDSSLDGISRLRK